MRLMSDLSVGDKVLSSTDDLGKPIYSDVVLFFHRQNNSRTAYYELLLEDGRQLTVTGSHLLHLASSSSSSVDDVSLDDVNVVYAGNVRAGDRIFVTSAEVGGAVKLRASRIVRVTGARHRGLYAPLTRHGTVVVDGVLVSCYAWVSSHRLAHAALLPARIYYDVTRLWNGGVYEYNNNGGEVHWYAELLFHLAPYVLSETMMFSMS